MALQSLRFQGLVRASLFGRLSIQAKGKRPGPSTNGQVFEAACKCMNIGAPCTLTERNNTLMTRSIRIESATPMVIHTRVQLSMSVRHLMCRLVAVVSKTKSYAHTSNVERPLFRNVANALNVGNRSQ